MFWRKGPGNVTEEELVGGGSQVLSSQKLRPMNAMMMILPCVAEGFLVTAALPMARSVGATHLLEVHKRPNMCVYFLQTRYKVAPSSARPPSLFDGRRSLTA